MKCIGNFTVTCLKNKKCNSKNLFGGQNFYSNLFCFASSIGIIENDELIQVQRRTPNVGIEIIK